MKKRANAHLQRQRNKKPHQRVPRQAKRRLSGSAQSRGETGVGELFKTIPHVFPDLLERLRELEDGRGKSDYALSEILMAGIALFIFQQGARNAFNNKRQAAKFKRPDQKLFKLRLPHRDTVRVSKNAIFGPNSLPGFWTQRISLMIPIRPGFGTNQ